MTHDSRHNVSKRVEIKTNPDATQNVKANSFKADLAAELQEEIAFSENGNERKITKQKAIIKTLVQAAIRDMKAVNALLACMRAFGAGVEERTAEYVDVEDLDLLERYLTQQRKQQERSAPDSTDKKSKTTRSPGERK